MALGDKEKIRELEEHIQSQNNLIDAMNVRIDMLLETRAEVTALLQRKAKLQTSIEKLLEDFYKKENERSK